MSLRIFDHPGSTPIQYLGCFQNNERLYIKREDLIHPTVSGNKWRKLKYNIIEAANKGFSKVITLGGAFSNHIHATAAAGAACGLHTIGLIRGEIVKPLNPTLKQASEWGMELVPVSRERYRKRADPQFLAELHSEYPNSYYIPEGGSNVLALKGCAEMTNVDKKFDFWCVSCGTGGTLAGLALGLAAETTVLGFTALKGGSFLDQEIRRLLNEAKANDHGKWKLISDYHFGGYAKISDQLTNFMAGFKQDYQILLDPIYTGKLMFGVFDLLEKGFFPANSSILALHTGGLQGIAGIEKKYGIEIK